MTDRELMQMALEALELVTDLTNHDDELYEAIEALRARLAQPEPEPVDKAGSPCKEFWDWLPKAYRDGDKGEDAKFTKYNMEVAYLAGKQSQLEPEPVAWFVYIPSQQCGEYFDSEDDYGLVDWMTNYPDAELTKLYTAPPQQPERKLWLWKNFVDGRPEYWAFDNPYPTNLDNGDPQTLGQPCGYAIFKPSRDGSRGRTEEQVLREMESVSAPPQREWQGLTDEEVESLDCTTVNACDWNEYEVYKPSVQEFARAIEAKLKEKNA